MDEFARMMSMEGVRPLDRLDRPKQKSPRLAKDMPATLEQRIVTPLEPAVAGYAWATVPLVCPVQLDVTDQASIDAAVMEA